MKKNINRLLSVILLLFIQFMAVKPQQVNISTVKIISGMTLEEKAALVVGMGKVDTASTQPVESVIGNTMDLVPGAAGTTYQNTKSGITSMVLADGPAGLRILPKRENESQTYFCTAFPVATALASTWDTALISQVGAAMGNEALEYGVDILLAPALNIHRNPLCGRNFEYYSEDPFISGKIASAMIKGVQSQGVGTSIKHFAVNNQETNRFTVNTLVSQRALREIYLEGFRIAVQESHPWTVMSSYNKINGVYTSESYDLLTKILRDDWEFKGFVMTDWFGGTDIIAQMKAGNDLIMPGMSSQKDFIVKAVKEGRLDEKILDRNVDRILTVMMDSPHYKNYQNSDKPNISSHAETARRAAADGMILLKNDNQTLPLNETVKQVAVFGYTSYKLIKGGLGSGNVYAAYTVSLIDGLIKAGYTVDETLKNEYLKYIAFESNKQAVQKNVHEELTAGNLKLNEMQIDDTVADRAASACDVALITIGRNSGEGVDHEVIDDFNLTESEKNMISSVSKAFQSKGKKVIVILNIGTVIEVASWRNNADAILLAWQPGQEAGNSIVDIISGKVNPSGKLTSTFPISYTDVPSAKNFPGKEIPGIPEWPWTTFTHTKQAEVIYEEDIYVGYRYYNTFKIPVAYEFGYGLSYSEFEFGEPGLSSTEFKDKLRVTIDVRNIGKVVGREVVQLYLSAPSVKLNKPREELKGFAKTKLLKPGEKQTISFEISKKELASFDPSFSAWVAEPGKYTIRIGNSSRNILRTAIFTLPSQIIVEKVSNVLTPPHDINVLMKSNEN